MRSIERAAASLVGVALIVAVAACASPAPSSSQPSAGLAAPDTSPRPACAPTLPNGDVPPGESPAEAANYLGNGRLYTALWPDGVILADPSLVEPDGRIAMKFPWWRAPGVGAAGDLVISGQELSTGAPIEAVIPDGYGQRFQASGIYFPTEGCYRVTGRSADAELSLVTFVVRVGG
jgi:hypothetical protein